MTIFWKDKGEVGHLIQGILNKIINRFLIKNIGDQKAVSLYIQNAKRKILIENPTSSKTVIQNEGKIKIFSDKQELKEIITIRSALQKR